MSVINHGSQEQIDQFVNLVDQEFIFSRGRKISLQRRFYGVFSKENSQNIYLAEEQGKIVAGTAVKSFEWITPEGQFKGAMIGAVCTHRDFRGQGLSSKILNFLEADLLKRDYDFLVLWTGIQDFYLRLGWEPKDSSLLAELTGITPPTQQSRVQVRVQVKTLEALDLKWISPLMSQHRFLHVKRSGDDLLKLPVPSEKVEVLSLDRTSGYALLGTQGQMGFLYDVAGKPEFYQQVWSYVTTHFNKILVDSFEGDPFSLWLSEEHSVHFEKKNLTMWIPLTGRFKGAKFKTWYIPYFDRI